MGESAGRSSRDVLKAIEERRKRRKEEEKNIDWYSWLLSDHPFLVLFLCLCLIVGCVVVSVVYVEPPDFSEPSKGFEVRGTALSDRVITWRNMYDNTGFNQTLSTYPTRFARLQAELHKFKDKTRARQRNRKSEGKEQNSGSKIRERRSATSYTWNFTTDGFFCHNPKSSYARMVMQSTDPTSVPLWSREGMLAVCNAEKRLLSYAMYSDVCTHLDASTCCPTLSLPNYITFLTGLATCEEINDTSMRRVGRLLKDCAAYYANGTLEAGCWDARRKADSKSGNVCRTVPTKCTKNNAVYSIFHYLTDTDFLLSVKASQSPDFNLEHTAVFLPALRGQSLAKLYYEKFKSSDLAFGQVEVTGIDFGLKDTVFDDALHMDSIFPIIAMVIVMVVIVLYTQSVFITFMSVTSSISSLFMAYFLYTVIFEFAYFPFMNLTAIMVMVGIGADNVVVYCSAWRTYKEEDSSRGGVFTKKAGVRTKTPANRLGVVTKVTLRHAARSMFVTGVTTASAFLSNFASSVTAIKCFGIYTGLTVLMNLFLCVTWLPASVIVHEKHFVELWNCCTRWRCLCLDRPRELLRIFFQKVQIYLIVRWRWFWITLGMALAIGGCLVIFVSPKLRLPTTSSYFQYFKSSHPFEAYTILHTKKFAFEKKGLGYMPVTVVFGVTPTDNGNQIDPDDSGSLVFNQRFNMSSPNSQTWLLNFCEKVRRQSFYKPTQYSFDKLRMCFVEAFKEWMGSIECFHNGQDNRPCCRESTFPYSPAVFNLCLKKAVLQLSNTPGIRLDRLTPGPRFDANDTVQAVIVEFPSIQPYTGSYNDVANFYNVVETWLSKELETAPLELGEDAWFVSDLEFHALQHGLYRGTLTSIGLSVAVVCVALIMTTCNISITMLANVAITCTIFVVVGVLVLFGWELNILESVTISIAIGLSVDFTVHYAVAYLLVPASDRVLRVESSVSTMGPAIALAALTTFLAGLCMLPAQVTAYYKFGTFLMLVMAGSWFYSTYFFQALCSAVGPQGRCGSISSCCCGRCRTRLKSRYRKSTKVRLHNETSTSSRTCAKICSDKRRVSADSPSVTVVEMSSYTSA